MAQAEGTVDVSWLSVFLKVRSGTRRLWRFYDWTWGCRDCYIRHGLWSQRVAWKVRYQVPSSSLWGSCLLKGSCRFAPPQSASVFLFLCLRLHLPPSSSAYVFAHLCFRLPRSSCSSVVVCLRGSATVVCMLTVCAVFHAVRVKPFVEL